LFGNGRHHAMTIRRWVLRGERQAQLQASICSLPKNINRYLASQQNPC